MRREHIEHILEVVYVLTLKEIKVKYKRNILGYLWSLLYPLIYTVIFYYVLVKVLNLRSENLFVYLLTGMFSWQWFSNSINSSSFCVIGNASLVKKLSFPKYTLPASVVLVDAFHFLLSIPAITLFLVLNKIMPSAEWLYEIPLSFFIQFMFTYGIALLVSAFNVFFRDIERFTSLGLMMLFYLSPVLYRFEDVPVDYRWLYYLNPAFYVVEMWHYTFLYDGFNLKILMMGLVYACIILVVGFYFFNRLSYKFAEVL